MPRQKTYPTAWKSTGHGSYREVREGCFEVSWRPAGRAGPKCKRHMEVSRDEVETFLAGERANRDRMRSGIAPKSDWDTTITRYEESLRAKNASEKHRDESLKLVRALRDHALVPIDKVMPEHIERWLESIVEMQKADGREGWARTSNKRLRIIHRFYHWLYRGRRHNPADAVDKYPETQPLKRCVSPIEYIAVHKLCEPPLQDLLDFLLVTACRIEEAGNMKIGDVVKGFWEVSERKGRNDHRIPLPPLVQEIILRQPKHTDGLVWHKCVTPIYDRQSACPGRVTDFSAPIDSYWLCDVMDYRCEKADVAKFTAHDLRSAAGTWADVAGAHVNQIQKLLGHTKVSTTEIYLRSDGTAGSKVVQDLILAVREKEMQRQA